MARCCGSPVPVRVYEGNAPHQGDSLMKCLAIYVHHNCKGGVPEYVKYALKGVKAVADAILVVTNGTLAEEEQRKLEDIHGVTVLAGDAGDSEWDAYKAGIEHYGYDAIAALDNLLLTNDSYYGPIYPYAEMWAEMDRIQCHLWGIIQHPNLETDPATGRKLSNKPQKGDRDFWLAFRKDLIASNDFRQYWEGITCSENEAGEGDIAAAFQRLGYVAAEYIDFEKYSAVVHDPILVNDLLVIQEKCPIVKRDYFFGSKDASIHFRNDSGMWHLLSYLTENNLYDGNMIWDDLLDNRDMSEIIDNLSLTHVLPARGLLKPTEIDVERVALVVYIFHPQLVEYFLHYLKNVPPGQAKIIVTVDPAVENACRKTFAEIDNISFRTQPNRGRDMAALWITCRDVFDRYDYICFVHSKMSNYRNVNIIGTEFREHCVECLLYSEEYVHNILAMFAENPRLGILAPPVPTAFSYEFTMFRQWEGNYENTRDLLHRIGIHRDNLDPRVVFPIGSMYWARTDALATLAHAGLAYSDFPDESQMQADGLLPHAIERSISLIAQHNNYYTAYVAPDEYAGILLTNVIVHLRNEAGRRSNLEDILKSAGSRKTYQSLRAFLRRQYFRTALFSKITFGSKRAHYNEKRERIRDAIARLETLIDQDPFL